MNYNLSQYTAELAKRLDEQPFDVAVKGMIVELKSALGKLNADPNVPNNKKTSMCEVIEATIKSYEEQIREFERIGNN